MLLIDDKDGCVKIKTWENSGLIDYLLFGTWHPHNAWRVIGGLHYDKPNAKDYIYHTSSGLGGSQSMAEAYIERLSAFWLSDLRDPDGLQPPEFFIDYAFSRRIYPSWLNWAVEHGFYKIKPNLINYVSEAKKNPDFDKESTTYPPELDIAMQAWREVSATEGKGKPKARIKTWLDENTSLSTEAKNRISVVANWDKSGGATKSD